MQRYNFFLTLANLFSRRRHNHLGTAEELQERLLQSFTTFTIFIVFQCSRIIASLPGLVFRRRRAVFILLPMLPTSTEVGVRGVGWLIQASAWNQTCRSTNDRCEALASAKGCFLCFCFCATQYLSTEPRYAQWKKTSTSVRMWMLSIVKCVVGYYSALPSLPSTSLILWM